MLFVLPIYNTFRYDLQPNNIQSKISRKWREIKINFYNNGYFAYIVKISKTNLNEKWKYWSELRSLVIQIGYGIKEIHPNTIYCRTRF